MLVYNKLVQLLMRTLIEFGKEYGAYIFQTAFNNTNAIDIGGPTLCTFCCLSQGDTGKGNHMLTVQQISKLKAEYDMETLKCIIVDEASNVPIYVWAKLSKVFQQLTGNSSELFGGIPIIMVGDLGQKGPVQSALITTELMNFMRHKRNVVKQINRMQKVCGKSVRAKLYQVENTSHNAKINKKKKQKVPDSVKFAINSPIRCGCEIFEKAKWFELTKQQRSEDAEHTQFIHNLYLGQKIKIDDIMKFKPFTKIHIMDHTA